MSLLWRCIIFGMACTLVLSALLFGTVGKGSSTAFWLLWPGVWLTNSLIGPVIATSDSGGENFVVVVLASTVLNTVIYAAVFFAVTKIAALIRRSERPLGQGPG